MVTVEHLTKYYGDHLAVSDLSFEFAGSRVYGLLGPNGAGKSTTMNIMTGCLSATSGHVRIDGHDIFDEPEAAKKLIGYLPEQPPLYLSETPREYLRFVGEARGLKGQALKARIEEVIRLTGTADVSDRLMSSLSKGYRQRVGIAQALIGDPSVIILDEPTVGLDPLQIIEIRDLIRNLGKDHTVILSSHILSEVQMVCEEVLIIAKGKLVAFDRPDELEKHMMSSGSVTLTAEADADRARGVLSGIAERFECSCKEDADGTTRISISTGDADTKPLCREIFFAFAKAGCAVLEMSSSRANLEDVFIELTEGSAADPESTAEGQADPDSGTVYADEPDSDAAVISGGAESTDSAAGGEEEA